MNTSPFRFATLTSSATETYRFKNGAPASATSTSLACSGKFVAFGIGSSGNIALAPVDFNEYVRKDTPFCINAHGSALSDWSFSPHDDLLLATACGDSTMKLFDIPQDGLSENISNAKVTIEELESVLTLKWNPSASGVIACGGKNILNIVDTIAGKKVSTFNQTGYGQDITSLSWNYDGSQIGALNKSGSISIGDTRQVSDDFMSSGYDIKSVFRQPHHVQYVGNNTNGSGYWVIFGLDKMRSPIVSFYDERNMSIPSLKQSLDMSAGTILPFYDVDTNLMFVSMRGSTTMGIYDVTEQKSNTPKFQKTQICSLTTGLNGGALIPKRACDTHHSEVARLMVLSDDSTIVPHTCRVPRKVKGYDETLYPMTFDTVPSLTSNEWFANQNKSPVLVSMNAPFVNAKWYKCEQKTTTSTTSSPIKSNNNDDGDEIKNAEYVASSVRLDLNSKFATSVYRHIKASEPDELDKKNYYFDLRPSRSLLLQKNIAVNNLFFAIPWASTGGSAMCVYPLEAKGRIAKKFGKVRGHKEQVSCFDLSKHDDYLLATASPAGVAKVWRIPSKDVLETDLEECIASFECNGKVSRVIFHPYIPNILITCAVDFEKVGTVSFWDITDGSEKVTLPFHEDAVDDVDFDPYCDLIATTSKDGFARIINVRSQSVIKKIPVLENKRDIQVQFLSKDRIAVLGFQPRSKRTMSLWNVSSDAEITAKPMHMVEFDTGSSVMLSHYDHDSKLMFVGHYGGYNIDVFRFLGDKFEKLNMNTSFSDIRGLAFMSKHSCNVRDVEVVRSIRLSKDAVVPMSWTVLRKRVEFFQDDLFPETMANQPVMTSEEFFDGKTVTSLKMTSLQPSDMVPLSQAPPEELTTRQMKYKENLIKKDEVKQSSYLGHETNEEATEHFQSMATKFVPSQNRWDARQDDQECVADDEWDD